jgi:hypothetical protein
MEPKEEEWSRIERRKGWKEKNSSRSSTSFAEAARRALSVGEKKKKMETNDTYPKSGPPGFKEKEIKVRPVTYNGRVFSGFVTHAEAIKNIYQEGLKLDICNLHGVSFIRNANDELTVVYKLKSRIELSGLRRKFEYQRRNKIGSIDWICCVIDSPFPQEAGTQLDVFKHVKIEGCGYQLSEEELTKWLGFYGRLLSPIEEEVFGDEDGKCSFGNGQYLVKMKIERERCQK